MRKNILIADDDLTMMKLISIDFTARALDVDVRSAENGEEAIAAIERTQPDLLVLDLRMPKVDGFAVLDHLSEQKKDFPVIVLSNDDLPESFERCTTFGVKEFLVKRHVPLQTILERVSAYVA